jgi:hypothetical protein
MPAEKTVTPPNCPKGALSLDFEGTLRGRWYARVPNEHTKEDVLHASYFGLSQGEKGLRVHDVIEVEPENCAWRAEVRIMALVPHLGQVKTREQAFWDYAVKAPAGYKFVWDSPETKWTIYKGAVAVDAGFDSQDECLIRVQELIRDKAA